MLSFRHALEGERKLVTMLFADFKGSTALIKNLDPEETNGHLSPALSAMVGALHRYEGTVHSMQGDGNMALFGAALAHEDHAHPKHRHYIVDSHPSSLAPEHTSESLPTAPMTWMQRLRRVFAIDLR